MDEDYIPRMYRENETTEQVVNDHTGLRLADAGRYDLFAGMSHDDMIERVEGPDEGLVATRGPVQFQRPTRQEWLDRAQVRLRDTLDSVSMVSVRLTIGELSVQIGEFDTRQGSADLAALLRQVAGRLDP